MGANFSSEAGKEKSGDGKGMIWRGSRDSPRFKSFLRQTGYGMRAAIIRRKKTKKTLSDISFK